MLSHKPQEVKGTTIFTLDSSVVWDSIAVESSLPDRLIIILCCFSCSFLDLGLPLWLGGVPAEFPLPSHHQISSRGVTGCVRNVSINDRLLDLNSHLGESNSQSGCDQVDSVCSVASELCGDGGECVSLWENYRCICPPQTDGQNCGKGMLKSLGIC